MQTTLAPESATTAALDIAFNVAYELAVSLGKDDLIPDQLGESLIFMSSPKTPELMSIDAFEDINGPLLFASFEYGDWMPVYSAGQWMHSGQHIPAELVERWHELAVFAAAVVDCAQVQVDKINMLQASLITAE